VAIAKASRKSALNVFISGSQWFSIACSLRL